MLIVSDCCLAIAYVDEENTEIIESDRLEPAIGCSARDRQRALKTLAGLVSPAKIILSQTDVIEEGSILIRGAERSPDIERLLKVFESSRAIDKTVVSTACSDERLSQARIVAGGTVLCGGFIELLDGGAKRFGRALVSELLGCGEDVRRFRPLLSSGGCAGRQPDSRQYQRAF